jgi:hypothetical protein
VRETIDEALSGISAAHRALLMDMLLSMKTNLAAAEAATQASPAQLVTKDGRRNTKERN